MVRLFFKNFAYISFLCLEHCWLINELASLIGQHLYPQNRLS